MPITEPRLDKAAQGRVLNCIPSRDVEKDWSFGDAAGAGLLGDAAIPARFDLREVWWPVGDQGGTGSCVGWATADSLLRWHFVKAGRLGPDQRLSVRFIWMSAKETDEFISAPSTFIEAAGTSLKAALDVARNFGAVPEAMLSFSDGYLYQDKPEIFYAKASQLKIASYHNLDRNLAAWRRWIAERGPVLARLDVDATWQDATATHGRLNLYLPETAQGGHAVSFVGYDQTGFIVRNSWGEDWGDGGFAYASNAYALAAFTETYGVTVT